MFLLLNNKVQKVFLGGKRIITTHVPTVSTCFLIGRYNYVGVVKL